MIQQQVSCSTKKSQMFTFHYSSNVIIAQNLSYFHLTHHYPPTTALSLQETYTLESERNVVARHYEQTYDQVNHQIDSARQLVEIRKQSQDSPDRPYPRRPKNRVNNNNLI